VGVRGEARRLFEGPAHEWRVPDPRSPLAFFLLALSCIVVFTELLFVGVELALHGFVSAGTSRSFAFLGVLLLLGGNLKSLALWLHRQAGDTLEGLVTVALRRLWPLHFWLNPLGLFSLGLFLVFAPRAQPPFYYVAYGVLLWQAVGGLLAREAVPLGGREGQVAQGARAAHRQPPVFALLVVLVAAGFVDSLFP